MAKWHQLPSSANSTFFFFKWEALEIEHRLASPWAARLGSGTRTSADAVKRFFLAKWSEDN